MRAMLIDIGTGLFMGLVGLGVGVACTSTGQLSPLVECKLDALRVLPEDENQITLGDARDIWRRLRACHREAPDSGAP